MDISETDSDHDLDSVLQIHALSIMSPKKPTLEKYSRIEDDDIESSDIEMKDVNVPAAIGNVSTNVELPRDSEYVEKKKMSAAIFRYFMLADEMKQQDMGVNIDHDLQEMWLEKIDADRAVKLDDVGDALLHSLKAILCGGSAYKQLVPSNSALQCNRTVVVSVQQDLTYWAVLHCTWNIHELENFGVYSSHVFGQMYKHKVVVDKIKSTMSHELTTALTDMNGGDIYKPVDHIKMVVKQLKGFKDFTRKQAGALTKSTSDALQQLCDESAGIDSHLCDRNDKIFGKIYIRTNPANGQKFQVIRSAGKQTNAMLSCRNWMTTNAKSFLKSRTNQMDTEQKLLFFTMLQNVAISPDDRFDMIQLSQLTQDKLVEQSWQLEPNTKMMLADIILIGISKNQQLVKSVAANYRKIVPRFASTVLTAADHKTDSTAKDSENLKKQDIAMTANEDQNMQMDLQLPSFQSTSHSMVPLVQIRATDSNVPSILELESELHHSITRSITLQQFLQLNHLQIVPARGDGHCILNAWSIITGIPNQTIEDFITAEYLVNRALYTAFQVTETDLVNYLRGNQYNLQSVDSIINMICNGMNATAIIIEEDSRMDASNTFHYTVSNFEIIRPNSGISTKTVVLLKKGQHYDAIVRI